MRSLRTRLEAAPCIALGVAVIATLLLAYEPANARPLHVRDSFPKADAVFDGGNAQYIVRFDGLVDHAASKIDVTEDGKLVESLVPTGDSEPDVLAASAPTLPPGRYQLRWHVKSVSDGDFSDGLIRFTVAR
jgi:methionine-rich copper-binding protein CopC